MRTRTLTQLQEALADRASVNVAASGTRHTTAIVNARLNRAIQRWRSLCAEAGDDSFMKVAKLTTGSSTTEDTAMWAPNQYIEQPADFLYLRGLDILDGTERIEMFPLEELERNDFEGAVIWGITNGVGFPIAYRVGGTNEAGNQLLQLFPRSDGVYTVYLRYIPSHTDLATGSDTVDFIAGGEEWVVNDATIQTLVADGLAGSAETQALASWNAKLEQDLRFMLASRRGGASRRKLDTRGRRRSVLSMARWRVP